MLARLTTGIEITGFALAVVGVFLLWGVGVGLIAAGASCVVVGVGLGREA